MQLLILISFLIVGLCFSFFNVNASTRVNTRTEGNYLVPPDVIVAESNKNAILMPAKDKKGYLKISLTKGYRNRKSYRVHRLVAVAFIPNPNNLPEVN